MKSGRTLVQLAEEVMRQNTAKKDYLVDTRKMEISDDGLLNLHMPETHISAVESYQLNDIAHRQIGDHLGISTKYYDKMRIEYPELLATNINSWFQHSPSQRMIRTLDGNVRAFLSRRYRRIDNYEVLQAVLPILAEIEASQVESCEITETRMYVKVVNPKLTTEVAPGDVVQAGVIISNSEVGHGSISVQPLVYRLVCSNGMIVNDARTRRYHTGRVNEATENYELYSDETLEAIDHAFIMKLADTVKAAVDEVRFERVVSIMRGAQEAKITSKDIPQVVELATKEHRFTKEENTGVLEHLIRGGDLSLYGLANAVTRFSQDVESYDRATKLEEVGFSLLNMGTRAWKNINRGDSLELAA